MKCWDIFRFAHPRRVRPKSSAPNTSSAGFYSRTSVRCDIWIAKIIAFARFRFAHPRRVRQRRLINANRICHQISIHAPTWGATLVANRLILTVAFRFSHPREVRRFNCLMGSSFLHFDSRTRAGYDCPDCRGPKLLPGFDSLTSAECTISRCGRSRFFAVSIRAPA